MVIFGVVVGLTIIAIGTILPIPVNSESIANGIILFIMTAVMFVWFLIANKKGKLGRASGLLWILFYTAYTVYLLLAV